MKRKILPIFLLTILLFQFLVIIPSVSVVNARQSKSENSTVSTKTARCERVESKIELFTKRVLKNSQTIETRLNVVYTKLERTAQKLEELGYDTSALDAPMQEMLAEMSAASDKVLEGVGELEEAQDKICSDDSVNVNTLARTANQTFKEARENIRNAIDIFKDDIVPIIRDLISEARSNEAD